MNLYIYIYTHTILIIHSKAKDSLFLVSTESRTPFILSPCTHKEKKKVVLEIMIFLLSFVLLPDVACSL